MTRRVLFVAAMLALAVIDLSSAVAQAPDLKSIAGKWKGNGGSPQGTNPLEWTIKEDGTIDVVVVLPTSTIKGKAKMSVKDGAFFYDSATSSGPVTIEGQGDRRVLKYDATFKRNDTKGSAELKPAK